MAVFVSVFGTSFSSSSITCAPQVRLLRCRNIPQSDVPGSPWAPRCLVFRGVEEQVQQRALMASRPATLVCLSAPFIHASHAEQWSCRSCTCPGEDHPGPTVNRGRGAPEIDIFEAEKNKTEGGVGQVASQSAQFAPFTHDYLFFTDNEDMYRIFDPSTTRQNDYRFVRVCTPRMRWCADYRFSQGICHVSTARFSQWTSC